MEDFGEALPWRVLVKDLYIYVYLCTYMYSIDTHTSSSLTRGMPIYTYLSQCVARRQLQCCLLSEDVADIPLYCSLGFRRNSSGRAPPSRRLIARSVARCVTGSAARFSPQTAPRCKTSSQEAVARMPPGFVASFIARSLSIGRLGAGVTPLC